MVLTASPDVEVRPVTQVTMVFLDIQEMTDDEEPLEAVEPLDDLVSQD